MKVLLHICCGPCAIYPHKRIKEQKAEVTGFFYNPNIHPLDEYNKRAKAAGDYALSENFGVIFPKHEENEYFDSIKAGPDKPQRCKICWNLRLERTADYAKNNGFDAFTTTLLVSPYQDHQEIRKIGEFLAKSRGLNFIYEDFRHGFRAAHNEAKKMGLYCQKYCGCVYSLNDPRS